MAAHFAIEAVNGWHETKSRPSSSPATSMSVLGRSVSPLSLQKNARSSSMGDPQTPCTPVASASSWSHGSKNYDLLSPQRERTFSSKGKQRGKRGTDTSVYGPSNSHLTGSNSTVLTIENGNRTPHQELSALPKRSRSSFLGVASDALTFKKFGKKKANMLPLQVNAMQDVIEIRATHRGSVALDTEEEERERLRDAAAQSIGLDPEIMTEKVSTWNEESDEEVDNSLHFSSFYPTEDGAEDLASSLRIDSGTFSPFVNRNRAGSTAHSLHQRSNSIQRSVPMFPTTVLSLTSSSQLDAVLPKHYPAPSLLKFSLSKQWKTRYIIMTSPAQASNVSVPRPKTAPTVSYLHLFKSRNPLEKEIERLEINEDSIVFVNENNEEIAGRRNVLRVGGVDCGAMRKVLNVEENGRTMWFLQMTDPQELQKWITAIKNSVLSQRSIRAGLGMPAHSSSGTEPRGDMDVMLSIRAQSIQSPPTKENGRARGNSVTSQHDHSVRSLSQSAQSSNLRSPTISSSRSQSSAVSALRGLFIGSNRPRSPSSSGSEEANQTEESFGALGNSLMTMLRTNPNPSERPMSPLASGAVQTPPISPILPQLDVQIDRKIIEDPVSKQWAPFRQIQQSNNDSAIPIQNHQQFVGSTALQPPPRRRPQIMVGQSTIPLESSPYTYVHANSSTAESFGIGQSHQSVSQHGIPTALEAKERKPRIPSWSSISSVNSGASGSSGSGSKRWSRQGPIPRMLTPPNGSPPPTPRTQENGRSTPRFQSAQHPYAMDRSPSLSSSSIQSAPSPQNLSSGVQFSKRASGSSFLSTSTASSHARTTRTGRLSMPPPQRPAPNMALPPTPTEDGSPKQPSISSGKATLAHRALRLSLIGPPQKEPPSTILPPRPDEVTSGFHRRSSSSGSRRHGGYLYPIPASPIQSDMSNRESTLPQASMDGSRSHTSLKQRLRMLSGPVQIPTAIPQSPPTPGKMAMDHSFLPSSPESRDEFSSVHTSLIIGEPITTMQNDPNFLIVSTTPVISPSPSSWTVQDSEDIHSSPEFPEIVSLPPPPWRASRRSSTPKVAKRVECGDDNDSSDADRSPTSPPPLSSAVSIANLSL